MMSVLQNFDKVAAAGILARAALSLAYAASPAMSAVAGEDRVRASIIEEARNQLGLKSDDYEVDAIERIADYLDAESDKLIAPPDLTSAYARLSERGDLPSDLYQIEISANVKDLHGKGFPLEKKLIETTIHTPTVEQHFGRSENPEEPAMASLFAKSFRTNWPMKDFVMLVSGIRDGTKLTVIQAWRIYTSRVDVSGVKEPLDWLKRFTDAYGAEIDIHGTKAKFFNYAQISKPLEKKIEVGGKGKPRQIIISDHTRWVGGEPVASLITAIDSDKYRATLKALGVRQRDILEALT
jgi:hypothetical protein